MASAKMGEVDLKPLVAREIALAKSDRAELSKKQTKALEYYQGEMKDIPAEDGRSSVVSRDLADTMGWMLPGIIRVFTASDHMAVAEPVGAEDAGWAEQATDGINYVFWKDNDGYRIIHAGTWDSLLGGNGVIKTWRDTTPEHKVSFHSGLGEAAFSELVADDEVEVIAHTERAETIVDPETQQPVPLTLHDVKIKRLARKGRTRVEAIPPEDYGKDSDAKTCEDARFQYHHSQPTRSDLIEMGFDKAKVAALGRAAVQQTQEEVARNLQPRSGDSDPSMDLIDLYECYLRVDIDGDGIAEVCQIYWAGDESGGDILDWTEWEDETPFDDIPCEPMPHRWEARSIYDEIEDVQRIKTVMLRQANDNTYATNNPQRFVKGKILNPEELFSPNFGGAIFSEDGNADIVPLVVPFVANHAYDALNYQDQVIERRTGVSRQTMALDPDALQNQTATANQNARDAAYSQIELVARNQAELGWRKVFRKILRLEIKHQDAPRTIRMRGKFVEVDPRHWNADMDISINVGLGTGSRDRDMLMLREVQMDQMGLVDRLAAGGFEEKALEMLPYIHTTLTKKAESAGIKSPEMFYPDVKPEEIEQGKAMLAERKKQPPPEVMLEQMKQQGAEKLKQVDAQVTMQVEQGKNQLSAQQAEIDSAAQVRREQAQLEADLVTKEADRQNAIIIERVRQEGAARLKAMEIEFQREKMMHDAQLQREGMMNSAAMAERNNAARAEMAANKPQPNA